MTSIRMALADAERRLASIPGAPRQDAELLMAHALGVTIGELHLRHLDAEPPKSFEELVRRRLSREPLAYITEKAGFWTVELAVGPGVLIPRADSETLIEAAVEHFGTRGPGNILDLGTGPGTLLLAALDQWPNTVGLGVERSAEALRYARGNADRLGLSNRAEFRTGDWGDGVSGQFDLILCNPPYIETKAALDPDVAEWEPHEALFAGADGLEDYRRIAPQLDRLLAPDGVACLEIGEGQAETVAALLAHFPFTISSRADLRGIKRSLVLRR